MQQTNNLPVSFKNKPSEWRSDGLFYQFHKLPHWPRWPLESCPPFDVSTVVSLNFNDAASMFVASTFTSVARGDTYSFFIYLLFFLLHFLSASVGAGSACPKIRGICHPDLCGGISKSMKRFLTYVRNDTDMEHWSSVPVGANRCVCPCCRLRCFLHGRANPAPTFFAL